MTWTGAETQLRNYLNGLWGRNRRYGIVAAGRYVRFYKWDKKEEKDIEFWGVPVEHYHVLHDCTDVAAKMRYIRDNH